MQSFSNKLRFIPVGVVCLLALFAHAQTPVQPGAPGRVTAAQLVKLQNECRDAYRSFTMRKSEPYSEHAKDEACGLLRLACAVGARQEECVTAVPGILQPLSPKRK